MVSNVCIGNRLLYEIATKIWTFQIMKMHWTCLISIMGKTCSIHESSRKKVHEISVHIIRVKGLEKPSESRKYRWLLDQEWINYWTKKAALYEENRYRLRIEGTRRSTNGCDLITHATLLEKNIYKILCLASIHQLWESKYRESVVIMRAALGAG